MPCWGFRTPPGNDIDYEQLCECNHYHALQLLLYECICFSFSIGRVLDTDRHPDFSIVVVRRNHAQNLFGTEDFGFCRFSAPGIYFLEKLFRPVATVLVRSTTFLNKHFVKKSHNISVDELSHALELTDKAELSEENNILEGIIRFGGETVKEVMTSRLDMVDLDIRTSFKEVMQCIIENAYSRIPIYSGSRDNIKGYCILKTCCLMSTRG